jgi:hypothetical protein
LKIKSEVYIINAQGQISNIEGIKFLIQEAIPMINKKCILAAFITLIMSGILGYTEDLQKAQEDLINFLPGAVLYSSCPKNITIKKQKNKLDLAVIDEKPAESFDPSQNFSGWLIWPFDKNNEEIMRSSYLKRSIDFTAHVQTPYGTFYIAIPQNIIAQGKHSKEEGLLVYLFFRSDIPDNAGYPYPEAIEAASKKGMLNVEQKEYLAIMNENYIRDLNRLKLYWNEFCQSPYLAYSRNKLFTTLTSIYDPSSAGLQKNEFEPSIFLDKTQRIALRKLGFEINGLCHIGFSADEIRLESTSSPLSQLIKEYNRILKTQDKNEELVATSDNKDNEIDISMVIKGPFDSDSDEAYHIVEGLLLGFNGVKKNQAH